MSEETRAKCRASSLALWANPEYRAKTRAAISAVERKPSRVRAAILKYPNWSNRDIAEVLGMPFHTVGRARQRMRKAGLLPAAPVVATTANLPAIAIIPPTETGLDVTPEALREVAALAVHAALAGSLNEFAGALRRRLSTTEIACLHGLTAALLT